MRPRPLRFYRLQQWLPPDIEQHVRLGVRHGVGVKPVDHEQRCGDAIHRLECVVAVRPKVVGVTELHELAVAIPVVVLDDGSVTDEHQHVLVLLGDVHHESGADLHDNAVQSLARWPPHLDYGDPIGDSDCILRRRGDSPDSATVVETVVDVGEIHLAHPSCVVIRGFGRAARPLLKPNNQHVNSCMLIARFQTVCLLIKLRLAGTDSAQRQSYIL